MTTLKEKIEHKFEFDEQKLGPHLNKMKVPYDAISSYHIAEGARWHHDQFTSEVLPILLEVQSKLEEIRWSWENDAGRQCDNLAHEALERLRKWVEG